MASKYSIVHLRSRHLQTKIRSKIVFTVPTLQLTLHLRLRKIQQITQNYRLEESIVTNKKSKSIIGRPNQP